MLKIDNFKDLEKAKNLEIYSDIKTTFEGIIESYIEYEPSFNIQTTDLEKEGIGGLIIFDKKEDYLNFDKLMEELGMNPGEYSGYEDVTKIGRNWLSVLYLYNNEYGHRFFFKKEWLPKEVSKQIIVENKKSLVAKIQEHYFNEAKKGVVPCKRCTKVSEKVY